MGDRRMVFAHSDETLECTADGQPLPNIRWFKSNMEITNTTFANVHIIEDLTMRSHDVDSIHSRLIIRQAELSNAGNYICNALNLHGSVNGTLNLYIQTGIVNMICNKMYGIYYCYFHSRRS